MPISRATAVQDSHTLIGIISMILASVLRARMRCGSLEARSVNTRELRPFRIIEAHENRVQANKSPMAIGLTI